MTALQTILADYRATSQSERENRTYFRYEASFADLYSDVWLFADWACGLRHRRTRSKIHNRDIPSKDKSTL